MKRKKREKMKKNEEDERKRKIIVFSNLNTWKHYSSRGVMAD